MTTANKNNQKSDNSNSAGKSQLFGTALIAEGVISTEQLDNILKAQKEKQTKYGENALLGMIVVELGYASEKEIIIAINEHFDIPATSLDDDIDKMIKAQSSNLFTHFQHLRTPIWLQFSIATTIIIVAVIFIMSMINLQHQKDNLYQQTTKIGMVSLNYFSNNARIPLLDDNYLQLNMLLNEATSVEGIVYAMIVNLENTIIAHTNPLETNKTYQEVQVKDGLIEKDNIIYFNSLSSSGVKILNLSRPVTFKDKKLGTVRVGVSIDFIEKIIEQERQYILILMLISILLGIIIAVILGRRFSRPISRLVVATKKIAAGNYQHKVYLKRNDELGDLASAFNEMSQELWLKGLMQNSFGKYVGADVLQMIIANPAEKWLSGKRSDVSVVFTDIRGFTAYCESKAPEEVVEQLNKYFSIATKVILDQGGYVDKFIGDAVLGVFGVPVYHADHMQRAVQASLIIQQELEKASKESGSKLLANVGIGINSGVVVSGNIGSEVKMEYTVIGDTVNVASRLNHLAGSGEVIIGSNIKKELHHMIKTEALPACKIKGISELVETYKVLNMKGVDS